MSSFFETLVDKYPAFHGLVARWRASRVPLVLQNQGSECGLASLAMVLGYYGRVTTLDDVRARLPVSPGSGASAQQLITTAETFGLRGRAVAIDLADLTILPTGSILHWNFGHYVVLERTDEDRVHLADPGLGRHSVDWKEAGRAFTGVAVLLEPSDDFKRKSGTTSTLTRLLQEILSDLAWRRVILMALTLQVLAFAMPALTGLVIERIVPQGDDRMLSMAALSAGTIVFFFTLASLVRSRMAALVMMRVSLQLRVDFVERLLKAPMRFVYDRQAGDIAFMNSGIDSVLQAITSGTLTGLVDAGMALVFVTLLLVAQTGMGIAVLVAFSLHFLLALWSNSRLTRLAAAELYASRRLASESTETVYGFETIKSLGLEGKRITGTMNALAEMAQVQAQSDVTRALNDSLQSALRFGAPLTLLLLGTVQVRAGTLSIGQMFALTSLGGAALIPLVSLTTILGTFPRVTAYLDRVQDVLKAPAEQDPQDAESHAALTGAVALRGVSFRYSPITPIVLKNITLEVKAGEFLAIVGRSGCGKSTLAGILLGLMVPDSGQVEFDGEDLQRLELVGLRQQIGYVPQRPYLFSQSIRDNLTVGDPTIALDQVIEAAKLAQIHDEIQALPLGYETGISSFAVFSGGQRQRLAVARALLRKPKLLLLDEATSAVDAITERKIDEVVRNLGCTRIVIAHRLSTIERADRIVVMDEGAIQAVGPLKEVLERSALFRELYQRGTTGSVQT